MAHYSLPYLPKADWQPLEKLAQRVLKTALTRAYNDISSNKRPRWTQLSPLLCWLPFAWASVLCWPSRLKAVWTTQITLLIGTTEALSTVDLRPPDPASRMTSVQTTEMTKTKLDMSAIMAKYTQQVIAEQQRSQAVREGRLPASAPSTVWGISDRHWAASPDQYNHTTASHEHLHSQSHHRFPARHVWGRARQHPYVVDWTASPLGRWDAARAPVQLASELSSALRSARHLRYVNRCNRGSSSAPSIL